MRNISKIILLMHLLTSAGLSFAASYPGRVPATGETGGAAGSASGVAWPNPRFVIGSGATANCITDKLTGLMWVKDLSTVVIKDGANGSSTTWQNALDSVKLANSKQGYCGYKDWRLPNLNQLKSLINYSQDPLANWLNSQGFKNVQQNNSYWSSTSLVSSTDQAWHVFHGGNMNVKAKSDNYYVLPVRRAQ